MVASDSFISTTFLAAPCFGDKLALEIVNARLAPRDLFSGVRGSTEGRNPTQISGIKCTLKMRLESRMENAANFGLEALHLIRH